MSDASAGRRRPDRRLPRGGRLALAVLTAVLEWGLWAVPVRAANDFAPSAIGTAGSQFLTLDIGARGIAMGGAYTAVTDDAYSLYWNPAGLAKIPRLSVATMYSMYVQDISYQSASYAQRIDDNAVVAAGFRYQDLAPSAGPTSAPTRSAAAPSNPATTSPSWAGASRSTTFRTAKWTSTWA